MALTLPWLEKPWNTLIQCLEARRLPHGLLVHGPRGLGKAQLSRLLAARLLCLDPQGGDPCGTCRSCQLIASGTHPDHMLLAPDNPGGQIKVDGVRDVISRLGLTPGIGTNRLALILDADRMNRAAANALLKTLEEPAGNVWLLLVTDRPGALPATIRSRCMQISIALPSPEQAAAWLGDAAIPEPVADEADEAPKPDPRTPDNLALALRLAGGAPLLARELLGQGSVARAVSLLEDLTALDNGDSATALVDRWKDQGAEAFEWLARWSALALREQALGTGASELPGAFHRLASQPRARLETAYRAALECGQLAITPVRNDLLLTRWISDWGRAAGSTARP